MHVIGAKVLDPSRFVVSAAIKPSDAKKFYELENQQLTPPDGLV
jgi:hypothetical protein